MVRGEIIVHTHIVNVQVRFYLKDYFGNSDDWDMLNDSPVRSNKSHESLLTLSFSGGVGFLVSSFSDDLSQGSDAYVKKLRSGFFGSADLAGFITSQSGIDVRISRFQSSNNESVRVASGNGNPIDGTISDDIRINFLGIYYIRRSAVRDKRDVFLFKI